MLSRSLIAAAAVPLLCALGAAQEKVDLTVVNKIKAEAFENSQVMDHLFYAARYPDRIEETAKRMGISKEAAIAGAQSTIYNAMRESGLTRAEVGRRMGTARSYVSRMLQGDYNLTIRTYARALAACGFEARFSRARVDPQWSEMTSREELETQPASANEQMALAA